MEQMQLFDELIWSNPEICNSCFARIRQVTELNPDESVSKYAPTEDRRRTQDALRGHDEESHDRYGERRTWRSVTFCRQCGSKNGLASDETLSKSEAVECIIEIAGRLEEMGYDVNLAPMRQLVKRGKSRETLRNHDRELLAYATAHGVQPNAD